MAPMEVSPTVFEIAGVAVAAAVVVLCLVVEMYLTARLHIIEIRKELEGSDE